MPYIKYIIGLGCLLLASLQTFADNSVSTAPDSIRTDAQHLRFSPECCPTLADSVINYGKLFLNYPYRYGSPGDSSFDCSGFTSYVYRNFGYNLQRSSSEQAQQFPTVDKTQVKPGDLVFFNGHRRNGRVGHVGIVVETKEDGEFNFIHASVKEGVTISNSKEDYYLRRFVKAGRVINSDSFFTQRPSSTFVNRTEYISTQPSQTVQKLIPAEYHYVKSGETLSEIAGKYGLTIAQLKRKNGLKKNAIHPRQRLKVKDEEKIMIVGEPEKVLAKAENAPAVQNEASTPNPDRKSEAKLIEHKVKNGESLYSIAKTYNIPVNTISEINSIKNGRIFPGQILRLSGKENAEQILVVNNNRNNIENQEARTFHRVASGETLGSISRKYKISIDDLKKFNQLQSNKLSVGQSLFLSEPQNLASIGETHQKADKKTEKQITDRTVPTMGTTLHKVQKGENLFSIAKKYGMTYEELMALNNLDDQKISINQYLNVIAQIKEPNQSETKITKKEEPVSKVEHKVSQGESLYSIAQKYKISVDELKAANNTDGSKLKAGQTIIIPGRNNQESQLQSISLASNNTKKKPGSSPLIHKVTSGETLGSIAEKYDCTVKELKDWNKKANTKLSIGEPIKIFAQH
jgi:LysM repeat protein